MGALPRPVLKNLKNVSISKIEITFFQKAHSHGDLTTDSGLISIFMYLEVQKHWAQFIDIKRLCALQVPYSLL